MWHRVEIDNVGEPAFGVDQCIFRLLPFCYILYERHDSFFASVGMNYNTDNCVKDAAVLVPQIDRVIPENIPVPDMLQQELSILGACIKGFDVEPGHFRPGISRYPLQH